MFLRRNPEHRSFGLPAGARFFFEGEDGGGAQGIPNTGGETKTALGSFPAGGEVAKPLESPQERTETEVLPDFGKLGKKPAAQEPPKPPETPKAPAKEEKPAGGQPKPKEEAPKKPAEQAKPPEKQPEKPKAQEKPPEKVAETKKPAAEEKKAGELPEIPEDDKDLDAFQPKPNINPAVAKNIKDLREIASTSRQTAKAYKAEVERLRTEFETVKQASGKIPPEIETELEGLRKFNMLFQAENDPKFKAEFDAKVEKAESGIYGLLTKHGLSEKIINEIKEAGKKNGGDILAWPRWNELISKFSSEFDKADVLAARNELINARGARAARLAEIGSSKEKFLEEYNKRHEGELMEFSKGVEQASIQLAAANDWILEREIPADASEEQKKAIEAENAAIKGYTDKFSEYIRATHSRDPQKSAEIALAAVQRDVLQGELESVTLERDKLKARADELEQRIAKIKSAGRMAHVETPKEEIPSQQSDAVGGDGAAAIRNFKWGAGRKA